MFSLCAIIALVSIQSVSAISSGLILSCAAGFEEYGCPADKWTDGNRKLCEEPGRIMPWATEAVEKGDVYRLFLGDDENDPQGSGMYVPGGRMNVRLRVTEYNAQYRGLFMFAEDENGERVGEWDFVDLRGEFHSHCPNTVLHGSAQVKPYLTSWGFTAPTQGTGKITFKALIKTGVANVGDFFTTNEIVLEEGVGANPLHKWFRASKPGMSCDDVCAENCKTCMQDELDAIDSADKVNLFVSTHNTCVEPALARCGKEGLSASSRNFCFFHDDATCDDLDLPTTAIGNCAAKADDSEEYGYRICPCEGPACTAAPTPEPSVSRAAPAPGVPLPSCELGTSGCECREDPANQCNSGLACGEENLCKCPGTVGCNCSVDEECTSVVDSNGNEQNLSCYRGSCLIENRMACDEQLGTMGCWCTELRECEPGLTCSDVSFNCEPDIQECELGSADCDCIDAQECQPGLSCALLRVGTICVQGSASAMTLALSLFAVVVFAAL